MESGASSTDPEDDQAKIVPNGSQGGKTALPSKEEEEEVRC